MSHAPPVRSRGFSLVEVLVVIAVMAVLLGLLMPALPRAPAASRTRCGNTLHQIGLALHQYEAVHRQLPPSRLDPALVTWAWLILPQLEQDDLYSAGRLGLPYFQQAEVVQRATIPVYFCPSR